MIVCPQCRQVNEEESQLCVRCGHSLEPGPVQLMPVQRTEAERPPIEIRTPKPPSPWRAVAVIGVLVLAVAGAGVWVLFRPNPCRGTNFTSTNFGYCLTVPEGWQAEEARFGSSVTLDQFSIPSQAVTVLVEAVDLGNGTSLQQFADAVRAKDEQSGLSPGTATGTSVDGVPAQQWDLSVTTDAGTAYQVREVVVVKDDVGWRFTLNDLADSFEEHTGPFEEMLRSFRFR
ncbi:MAG TPA: hypothetical protein VFC04_07565 [Actinomycetota bacterium]|nr:hypothetical protein [Actinomycetota bacterium]